MASILSSGPTGLILPGKAVRVPQSQLAVPNGLVNYWPLSYESINLAAGTVEDYTQGRDFPIPLSGVTAANLVDTPTGGGVVFDGTNNIRTTTAAALSLPEITTRFSMTCWVRKDVIYSGTELIFTIGNAGAGSSAYLAQRSDVAAGNRLTFTADGSNSFAWSDAVPSAGQYYFLAGVAYFSAVGGIVLFVNGQRQTFAGSSWGGFGFPNDTTVIGSTAGGGAKFTGTVFECRVYNRALDAAEVMELYQAGISGRRDNMFSSTQFNEISMLPALTPRLSGSDFGAPYAGPIFPYRARRMVPS